MVYSLRAVAEGQWLGYLVPGLSTVVAIVLLTLNKKLKSGSHCLSSPKCIVSTMITMLAGDWKPCDVLTSCSWRCSTKLSYVMDNLVLRSPWNCAGLHKWSVTRYALRRVRWSPLIRDPKGARGTWINFCWVCVAGLSEPLPLYSLFCGQL